MTGIEPNARLTRIARAMAGDDTDDGWWEVDARVWMPRAAVATRAVLKEIGRLYLECESIDGALTRNDLEEYFGL